MVLGFIFVIIDSFVEIVYALSLLMKVYQHCKGQVEATFGEQNFVRFNLKCLAYLIVPNIVKTNWKIKGKNILT